MDSIASVAGSKGEAERCGSSGASEHEDAIGVDSTARDGVVSAFAEIDGCSALSADTGHDVCGHDNGKLKVDCRASTRTTGRRCMVGIER